MAWSTSKRIQSGFLSTLIRQATRVTARQRPIRFEEFKPEQDWWGQESNDFADRVESEFAWKVDFKTKRELAETAAKPHWDRAEALNNEASALENRARDLRESLKGVTGERKRKATDDDIDILRTQADGLRLQGRDAQATGDRNYWPIYNLDLKNPNAPEEGIDDPDVLLDRYKIALGEIEETESRLKGELAAALAHHLDGNSA